MDAKIFRVNYKSDFILTLTSDAGWMTPFCIKFWTGAPSQAYYAQWDGTTYTHCAPVAGDPTKLTVQFDDHHLPIGDLKYQVAYHFTVADFPNDTEDEVLNQANITTEIDGEEYQVMLDFNGETAPEIQFSLPAYANEAQRIANEQQRIANEQQRIANEEARIAAETIRQQNEAQRISNEESRVAEFAQLKQESETATADANSAATLANEKAALAADKAALAQAAATLANEKAQIAADKAALAQAAATLANDKAALAQQKAEYAQTQGDYSKTQGDYAKEQGDTAQADHERAEADHTTAADDHQTAAADHTTAASDHTRAEGDHTTAASDHSRAEVDHSTASADHTTATNDHTQAVTDHATATSDHTQAGNDHTRAESDHTRAESDHAAVEVYVDSLGAFDISSYHATGGVLAKYADLTAALGTGGANIPDDLRKGGMSVKFVCSYDNKYVQYFLTKNEWNASEADWEKMNLEEEVDALKNGEKQTLTFLRGSAAISCNFKQGHIYKCTFARYTPYASESPLSMKVTLKGDDVPNSYIPTENGVNLNYGDTYYYVSPNNYNSASSYSNGTSEWDIYDITEQCENVFRMMRDSEYVENGSALYDSLGNITQQNILWSNGCSGVLTRSNFNNTVFEYETVQVTCVNAIGTLSYRVTYSYNYDNYGNIVSDSITITKI